MTGAEAPQIERALERFIVEELLEERYDGRDPLASGAVDSLAIEQLVTHIEEEFEMTIADDEMIEQNFESLPALAGFVADKRKALTP